MAVEIIQSLLQEDRLEVQTHNSIATTEKLREKIIFIVFTYLAFWYEAGEVSSIGSEKSSFLC
jgi:hypothetical protein